MISCFLCAYVLQLSKVDADVAATWENVVGGQLTNNFTEFESTAARWGSSAANSTQSFIGDGSIEFSATSLSHIYMVGLDDSPLLENTYREIKHAIYLNLDNLYVFENGVKRGYFGKVLIGDRFQILRIGSQIFYQKNGNTIYQSEGWANSETPLMSVVASYKIGSRLSDLKFTGFEKGGLFSSAIKNDRYSLRQDSVLEISAPGVLANDNSLNGSSLTAHLLSSTGNGQIVLREDGSFEYTPNENFVGPDSFTYQVKENGVPGYRADVFIYVHKDSYEVNAVGEARNLPEMQNGTIAQVGSEWVHVAFENETSEDPVVVCTPIYKSSAAYTPVIRRINSTGFEVKIVTASQIPLEGFISVNYFSIPKTDIVTPSPKLYQANKLPVNKVSKRGAWSGWHEITYEKSFENPVVFGQVSVGESDDNPEYLSFYSHGAPSNIRANNFCRIGAHVGEFQGEINSQVELNYVIFEAGSYLLDSSVLDVMQTGIKVSHSVYSYPVKKNQIENIVLSLTGIRGGDGSFPLVYGNDTKHALNLANSTIGLTLREDQYGDIEMNHTVEDLSVAVFSKQLSPPEIVPGSIAIFPEETGGSVSVVPYLDSTSWITTDNSEPKAYRSPVYEGPIEFKESGVLKARSQKEGYVDSEVADSHVYVMDDLSSGIIESIYHWPENSHASLEYFPNLEESFPKSVRVTYDIDSRFSKRVIRVMEGYLYFPESTTYTIYLYKRGDAGVAEFYFEDFERPTLSRARTQAEPHTTIYVEKGIHKVKLRGLCNYWSTDIALYWSYEGQSKTKVKNTLFFHNPEELIEIKKNQDYDNDGLTNLEELDLGTNIHAADTDNDGVSDYEEIKVYNLNALQKDSDNDGFDDFMESKIFNGLSEEDFGELKHEFTIQGSQFSDHKGEWSIVDNSAVSEDFRGKLNYHLVMPKDDMLLLELFAGASDPKFYNKNYKVSLLVNGQYVDGRNLVSKVDTRNANFAMNFSGSLCVKTAGDYHFDLQSQKDAVLIVNEQQIATNSISTGNIFLPRGNHKLIVQYLQKDKSEQLKVLFSGPDISKKEISSADLNGPVTWSYHEGSWTELPDFTFLSPKKAGVCESFDANARKTPISDSTIFILPWLPSGYHDLEVVWENGIYDKKLKVEKLVFKSMNGIDVNANGIKDWVDLKLDQEYSVKTPRSFKTSPLCLEGTAKNIHLVGTSQGSEIFKAPNNGWYTDIELNPKNDTDVIVSFQHGLKEVQKTFSWEKTHVPSESYIVIRKGDALLLDPNMEGLSGEGRIVIGEEEYLLAVNEALPYTFSTAGEYEVTSFYNDAQGNLVSATVTVKVIGLEFSAQPIVTLVGSPRHVDLSHYQTEHSDIEADSRLSSWYKVSENTFSVTLDTTKEDFLISRLANNGPILGQIKLQAMEVFGSGQTSFKIVDRFDDGSILNELIVVASPLLEGVQVKHKIVLTGVVFDDGATTRIYDKKDIDEIQQFKSLILKTPQAPKTAACNHIDVYQDGEFVGRVY